MSTFSVAFRVLRHLYCRDSVLIIHVKKKIVLSSPNEYIVTFEKQ